MIGETRFRPIGRGEGTDIQDEEIIARLRRGDLEALEAMMDRYTSLVCAVAARILPNCPQEWEEVASDVFLAAWDNRKKLRAGQVKGWLATVARNRALQPPSGPAGGAASGGGHPAPGPRCPSHRGGTEGAESGADRGPEQSGQGRPGAVRAALLLRSDGGQSAEEMGLNLSTAKTRLRRGRARLKGVFAGGRV